eukprot:Rhum_TRINITY_DN12247_c1_g1::Rhum_TRINITY_DN12247_c1_g1_i1::g.50215::m.50215
MAGHGEKGVGRSTPHQKPAFLLVVSQLGVSVALEGSIVVFLLLPLPLLFCLLQHASPLCGGVGSVGRLTLACACGRERPPEVVPQPRFVLLLHVRIQQRLRRPQTLPLLRLRVADVRRRLVRAAEARKRKGALGCVGVRTLLLRDERPVHLGLVPQLPHALRHALHLRQQVAQQPARVEDILTPEELHGAQQLEPLSLLRRAAEVPRRLLLDHLRHQQLPHFVQLRQRHRLHLLLGAARGHGRSTRGRDVLLLFRHASEDLGGREVRHDVAAAQPAHDVALRARVHAGDVLVPQRDALHVLDDRVRHPRPPLRLLLVLQVVRLAHFLCHPLHLAPRTLHHARHLRQQLLVRPHVVPPPVREVVLGRGVPGSLRTRPPPLLHVEVRRLAEAF